MLKFRQLFGGGKCFIIGMVHVGALPATPQFRGSVDEITSKACLETEIYLANKLDGILVENMHDVPYVQSKHFNPETTAVMSRICTEIKRLLPKGYPCGVQVLANGNKEALAIAKACGFNFIRAEGFVFSHIADEGFTDANAGQILRYRTQIQADDVLVLADIKKKHSSHAITSDVSLEETAKAAEFFLADGLVLTGTSTGRAADLQEFAAMRSATGLPLLVGSGVTASNLADYTTADAVIVGSHFKVDGRWQNGLDEARIRAFIDRKRSLE